MPIYRVTGILHASIDLGEIEADSEEEAIEIALEGEKNYVSLCHHCAHEIDLGESSAQEANAELIE